MNSICTRCDQEIIFGWVVTSGKKMPLDPARYEAGDEAANVAVSRDHLGRVRVRPLKKGEQPWANEWRGMPHFATCKGRPRARRQVTRGNVIRLQRLPDGPR